MKFFTMTFLLLATMEAAAAAKVIDKDRILRQDKSKGKGGNSGKGKGAGWPVSPNAVEAYEDLLEDVVFGDTCLIDSDWFGNNDCVNGLNGIAVGTVNGNCFSDTFACCPEGFITPADLIAGGCTLVNTRADECPMTGFSVSFVPEIEGPIEAYCCSNGLAVNDCD